MAVLSKIRERSIFLIIIIAMALFAFVLGDLFKYRKSSNLIGEVNGDPITREEFSKEMDLFKSRSGDKASQIQSAKAVWNSIISEKIFNKQLNDAGIVIGEEDVWNTIVNLPYIQSSPLFQNEAGLFDEEKLKEYLVTLKENAATNPKDTQWAGWILTEQSVKRNLEQNIYTSLVINGINSTLFEGKNYYNDQTTKSDIEYVFVPFNTIPDNQFKISDSEVKSYVNDREKQFQVEASRDLSFVKFDISPTLEDEEFVRKDVANMLNDKDEYSTAAKSTIKILGFKNTTNDKLFLTENNSDLSFSDDYLIKLQLPLTVADTILNAQKGDIVGPYKDGGFYKLSKIKDFKQIPDSVKASHILISFSGALRSTEQRTEAAAKIMADSIFALVKNDNNKFTDIAKAVSYDKGSGAKGGELGWFDYGAMVAEFRDFAFINKKGDVGVVKSSFGYHIIRIDDQKNFQKAIKMVTFGRKIEASEKTENAIFEKAETFTSNVTASKNFRQKAKESGYEVNSISGVKMMDESISDIKNQRTIVNWAFKKDTKVGNIKRFDTEDGYLVVQLDKAQEKGLMDLSLASIGVRRILFEQKKAEYITKGMGTMSLTDIAAKYKVSVLSSLAVSLASPVIPSVGRSIGLIGAINASKPGDILRGVKDNSGIYAVKIIKREAPTELTNYDSFRKQLFSKLQLSSYKLYNALEKESKIVDNRGLYY